MSDLGHCLARPGRGAPYRHRWAATSILMSAISDIRHRHLLFWYRKKIYRMKNCLSDIIIRVHSEIKTFGCIPIWIDHWPHYTWFHRQAHYHAATMLLYKEWDVGYRIKVSDISDIWYNVGLRTLKSDIRVLISGSTRYRWSRISD